jgi:hypothetical protein
MATVTMVRLLPTATALRMRSIKILRYPNLPAFMSIHHSGQSFTKTLMKTFRTRCCLY